MVGIGRPADDLLRPVPVHPAPTFVVFAKGLLLHDAFEETLVHMQQAQASRPVAQPRVAIGAPFRPDFGEQFVGFIDVCGVGRNAGAEQIPVERGQPGLDAAGGAGADGVCIQGNRQSRQLIVELLAPEDDFQAIVAVRCNLQREAQDCALAAVELIAVFREVTAVARMAFGVVREFFDLHRPAEISGRVEKVQTIHPQVPALAPLPVPVSVQEREGHRLGPTPRRPGNSDRLRVVPDAAHRRDAADLRRRRTPDVHAAQQLAIAVLQQVQLLEDDHAAEFHGMALRDRRHERRHVVGALGDAVRIDAAIEQAVFAIQIAWAEDEPLRRVGADSSPLDAGDRCGLAREFLRRQQPLHPRIAQRLAASRVVVQHRADAEPRRQDQIRQQVLQDVGSAALDAVAETRRQSRHLAGLRVGGEESACEAHVVGVLRRGRHFGAHDRRPPELHRGFGETLIRRDLCGQPAQAPVGIRNDLAVETGQAHVAIPGVALDIERSRTVRRFLVEIVERIHAAVVHPVVALVAVVLERARHRIENGMADRAGAVVHRRIVGVGEGDRVRCPRSGFLDVQPQEVIVGPARPRTVAVRCRARVAVQEGVRVEDSCVWDVHPQVAVGDDAQAELLTEPRDLGPVPAVVGDDLGRLELERIVDVLEDLCGGLAVDIGCKGIGHDVVGRQYLRVGQFLLRDVGDQLQRRPCDAVLHRLKPATAVEGVAVALATFVHKLGKPHEVLRVGVEQVVDVLVGQQAVVGGPHQKVMERRTLHQVPNGAADAHLPRGERIKFRRRRIPAGEEERGAAQRGLQRYLAYRVEQRLRRHRGRHELFAEQAKPSAHVAELRGTRRKLDAAAVRDALHLVQKQFRAVFD